MSYEIHALLGKREMLQTRIAAFHNAHIVPLAQGIAMIPLTEELHEEIGGEGERDHFYRFSPELEAWMQSASVDAPIAYVEAEYFGGTGCENAVVWLNGARVLGPVHADNAINQALQLLGVSAADTASDEFDAIGLGKHRGTESWLQHSQK